MEVWNVSEVQEKDALFRNGNSLFDRIEQSIKYILGLFVIDVRRI